MRTLVLGGTGIVGRALVREGRNRGWPVLGVSHGQGDISDRRRVDELCADFRPALIVNCAAFTQVDLCEAEPERALAVNGTAVGNLVRAAEVAGARLIHLSHRLRFRRPRVRALHRGPSDRAAVELRPEQARGRAPGAGERPVAGRPDQLDLRQGGANFVDTIAGRIRSGQKRLPCRRRPVRRPHLGPLSGQGRVGSGRMGRRRAGALSESAGSLLVRVRARDRAPARLAGSRSRRSPPRKRRGRRRGRRIRCWRSMVSRNLRGAPSSPGTKGSRVTLGLRQRSS